MSTARVLVIQHHDDDLVGAVATALDHHGVEIVFCRTWNDDPVPRTLDAYDGLVVLGGSMGVWDRPRPGHLDQELALLKATVEAGKPVMGLCLGSQLLAHALGGEVHANSATEIGWHEVTRHDNATGDELLHDLPTSFFAFQWHNDQFEIPPGAVPLASSPRCWQAFRFGANAYGLQFHLEVDEPKLQYIVGKYRENPKWAAEAARFIVPGYEAHQTAMTAIAERVFSRWVKKL